MIARSFYFDAAAAKIIADNEMCPGCFEREMADTQSLNHDAVFDKNLSDSYIHTQFSLLLVWLSSLGSSSSSNGTVYRVQGGTPPAASASRIQIDAAGNVTIAGDQMLWVTFDNLGRARAFVAQNRPGGTIVAFEVDQAFIAEVRATAMPQSAARTYPWAPQMASPGESLDSFGLGGSWLSGLEDAIIQGTGRVIGP